jgi:hypothetical protein
MVVIAYHIKGMENSGERHSSYPNERFSKAVVTSHGKTMNLLVIFEEQCVSGMCNVVGLSQQINKVLCHVVYVTRRFAGAPSPDIEGYGATKRLPSIFGKLFRNLFLKGCLVVDWHSFLAGGLNAIYAYSEFP